MLLGRLGTIAREMGGSVLVGMDWTSWSTGFASPDDERAWTTLRGIPAADSIGVALPNILLRLPYGKGTDPIESFVFAEQADPASTDGFLWGSAALAAAQLLGQAFLSAGGWDFSPGERASMGDLPIHVSHHEGESVQTPCAQAWLSDSQIELLLEAGLMPVVSCRGRGEVRIPRFQSIASPPTTLGGRWRRD